MSLHGKTALVTGGARGIGFATVQRLLREGARCVIWDRDPAAIQASLVCLLKTRRDRASVPPEVAGRLIGAAA